MLPSQVELDGVLHRSWIDRVSATDEVNENALLEHNRELACFIACHDLSVNQVLQSPSQLRGAMDSEETFTVMWDSGASCCISNDKKDFIGELKPAGFIKYLSGLAKGLLIRGVGTVA